MSDRSRVLSLAATTGSADSADSGGRLRQLDALRVLTCLSVVAVHSIMGPYPKDDPGLGVATSLLHYSREIFFFVSALVLVRTYVPRLGPAGRLADETGFRRRRLRLIGLPYLVWTTIYLLIWVWHTRGVEPMSQIVNELPLRWVYLVATGNGCYHLYFLLVTLQFAVVFPLFLRLLGATQGRHGWLLAGSGVLQLATLAGYHLIGLPNDGWRPIIGDYSLFGYQLWLVAGALAGLHLERMHTWLTEHRALVVGAVPVTAAALLWSYWAQVPTLGVLEASTPLQPMMVVWSTVMLGALYLAAVRLSRLRSALASMVFGYGAQLSFGVYLAHPLVLDLVLSGSQRVGLFAPSPWLAVVSFVLTVGGSVALCALIHRTRFSLALQGRGRLDPALAPHLGWPPRRPRLAATSASLLLLVTATVGLLIGSDQGPGRASPPHGWAIGSDRP
ncbi:MAG: acyltransferase [Actinomycetota bacterium]|nr:acyltransferase [Actinomycetota bacterium]